jgi:hypothetical protein
MHGWVGVSVLSTWQAEMRPCPLSVFLLGVATVLRLWEMADGLTGIIVEES